MITRYGCLILGVVASLLFLTALLTCRITGLPVAPVHPNEGPSLIEEGLDDVVGNLLADYSGKASGE